MHVEATNLASSQRLKAVANAFGGSALNDLGSPEAFSCCHQPYTSENSQLV